MKKYVSLKVTAMELREGYMTIVDALDDVLGVHGVKFVDARLEYVLEKKGVETVKVDGKSVKLKDVPVTDFAYRTAVIMRTMQNVQSYFCDTSRIKFNGTMLEKLDESGARNDVTGFNGRKAF